ncbi:hypothetical protein WICPIJ_003689 [Wickerhamomyces pijperi]|uniref:C2H2-type domain-containing protein n=1 Tax=Wickerhamomyces pijperi TaxID=599730 RepID=A0A9P8Q6P0_WICPI|nr:hypothetical protein WICPIJ_003689 [Wickerhamomyces pijperi]
MTNTNKSTSTAAKVSKRFRPSGQVAQFKSSTRILKTNKIDNSPPSAHQSSNEPAKPVRRRIYTYKGYAPKFVCDECNKAFPNRLLHESHKSTVHSLERPSDDHHTSNDQESE